MPQTLQKAAELIKQYNAENHSKLHPDLVEALAIAHNALLRLDHLRQVGCTPINAPLPGETRGTPPFT